MKQIMKRFFEWQHIIVVTSSFLTFLTGTNTAFADNQNIPARRRICGQVTDLWKNPLDGVLVKLVNTQICTRTNNKGYYTIEIPDTRGEIQFCSAGFRGIKIVTDSITSPLDITLETNLSEQVPDNKPLEPKDALKQSLTDFMEEWFKIIVEIKKLTHKEVVKRGSLSMDEKLRLQLLWKKNSENFSLYSSCHIAMNLLGLDHLEKRLIKHLDDLSKENPDAI